MEEIRTWLAHVGLSEYSEAFERNAIELGVLPELTDEDLREVGVGALGHRKKLLAAIRLLSKSNEVIVPANRVTHSRVR